MITVDSRKTLGFGDAFANDPHRIARAALENGKIDLLAQRLQLVDRRRAIDVGGNQQRTPPLLLEAQGELSGLRRLSGSLQADQHDDRRRRVGELQTAAGRGAGRPEKLDELRVNDGKNRLRGRQRFQDVGADRPLSDARDEVLGRSQRDVGFEQGDANFAQGLVDFAFGYLTSSA